MKISFRNNKKRIYLDYAASAPVLDVVVKNSVKLEKDFFGNPSSIHVDGVKSWKVLEEARTSIAKLIDAHSDEIIFTGGGTESNALAIVGAYNHAKTLPEFAGKQIHIVTTEIEHPSVLETCRMLERNGTSVTYMPVEHDGLVSIKTLKESLRPETILVTIGYANNEIGTVQPIREIAKTIRSWKKHSDSVSTYPLIHIDACQAAAYLEMNVEKLGIDLMTWNSSKLGGPHGVGALYVRRNTPLAALYEGGGQENNLRSGTENVPSIIGFATAFAEARKIHDKESARLGALRDFCIAEISATFPSVRINGDVVERLPNNVNISFPKFSSELLVVELDAKGISVSAGSACGSMKDAGSHVITALYGKEDEKKWGTIRISMGKRTTITEIRVLLVSLENIFEKYSKAGIL